MDITAWLTIAAIVIGPIAAVLVTRYVDERRDARARRMEIFRTLMRTRRTPHFAEHVGALNLVEIEFAKYKDVIDEWKHLFEHLGTRYTQGTGESLEAFNRRLNDERQSRLTLLLHAMAKSLGHKVDQIEILQGGYGPQIWADIEDEQTAVRRLLLDILSARRPLPVHFWIQPQTGSGGQPALPSQ